MIKASGFAFFIISAVVAPSFASAQDQSGVTRAQVEEELVQLENAGYSNPGADDHMSYPVQLQAAEARVTKQSSQLNYAQSPRIDSGLGLEAAK
jgi:hypothetical protein